MTAKLEIYTLGGTRFLLDGEPLTRLNTRKVEALAIYLAYNRRPYPREVLADMLWDERSQKRALSNLRVALTNLRKYLDPFFTITRDSVVVDEEASVWLDAAELESLLAGDQASGNQATSDSIDQIETAIALYQGEFLQGFSLRQARLFEQWTTVERERLHYLVTDGLSQVTEWHLVQGDYPAGIRQATRWLQLDPLNETACRGMMRLLAYNGQAGAALRQYQECVRVLDEELGLAPSPETVELYEAIHSQQLRPPKEQPIAVTVEKELPPESGEPPFKGLAYYDVDDAHLFFGREELTTSLVGRLKQDRFLAVVGASGSGKSSLIRAGLLSALRSGQRLVDGLSPPAGSRRWPVHLITPTDRPLKALALSLTREAESARATTLLMDDLAHEPRSLNIHIEKLLADTPSQRLLLVVDQFEELFTQCRDEAERQAFIDNLLAAVTGNPGGAATIVITLRADFYAHCARYDGLRELLETQQAYIGQMAAGELRQAIQGPAETAGWTFEPGLVDLLLHDVGAGRNRKPEPGALPLLSHALLETWRRRRGREMTFSGYAETGGVRRAIARTAEAVFNDELASEQRPIARSLFLRLTELGEGAQDTRRRATLAELIPRPEEALAVEGVLKTLADARLITTGEEGVEVAHEALIREWPRLGEWLAEDREGLRLHRQLTEAAQSWQALARDEGVLYRGVRLAQAGEWAESHGDQFNPLEQDFLEASQAQARREEAEREAHRQRELEAARTLRRRAALLAGALVVAALLAIAAFFFARQSDQNATVAQDNAALAATREAEALTEAEQRATAQAQAEVERQRADEQRDAALAAEAQAEAEAEFRATAEAEAILERETAEQQASLATSRELALAALNNLEADPELTILLALQALDTTYTKEAEEALRQGIQASRVLMTLADHSGIVYGSIYSPDGSHVATVSDDGTVKVWEAASGRLLHTMPYAGADFLGQSLVFDETGNELALVALGDNYEQIILHIWNTGSGELLQQIELPIFVVRLGAAALSPDWQLIAPGREDGTVELWEVATAKKLLTLSGHDAKVGQGVSFSPDGSRLVTASWNGQVRVWDVEASLEAMEGQLIASFTTQKEDTLLLRAYFNPDGTQLALGFLGDSAEVWDLADTSQPKFALSESTGWDIAFHPDNTYLATGGDDAKMWDLTTGEHLFTLSGHQGTIRRLDFSPDGSRLLTAADNGTARIWNVQPHAGGELLTFAAGPATHDLELSPDEQKVALGSERGPATVWDATTGDHLLTLPGEPDTATYRVAFNPDGSRLATVGEDGFVRIWDAETGDLLLRFTGHSEGSSAARFGTLDVEYSPDGSQLATAGADKLAKVWDAGSGEELLTLAGHTAGLVSLEYSPDGRYLATSSDSGETSQSGGDTTVKVWDARTGEEVYTLGPNPNRAWGLAFSPDSNLLATSGSGGYIKVWDMTTGEELINMTGQASTIGTVTFTPDGQQLISGGGVSASIWDIATGTELVNLTPKNSSSVALTQDGRRLYAAGYDTLSVRVYAVPLEDAVALAQSRLTRSLSTAECRQYLHVAECPAGP